MKKCSTCNECKAQSEFQVRRASKDGLTASCKHCLSKRDSTRYKTERVRRLKQHKEYANTEQGKAARKSAVARYAANNPKRRSAQIAVNNAVRDGNLIPLPCFECGNKAEAHHPDYDRPLDVIWLCVKHHKEVHKMAKAA